jgi:hypothetical protein
MSLLFGEPRQAFVIELCDRPSFFDEQCAQLFA